MCLISHTVPSDPESEKMKRHATSRKIGAALPREVYSNYGAITDSTEYFFFIVFSEVHRAGIVFLDALTCPVTLW